MANMPSNPSFSALLPADLVVLARRAYQSLAAIGEEALELIITLWILIMVERAYGQSGVGIYSYLIALLYIARYIADFGLARHLEHEVAIVGETPSERERLILAGVQATVATSLLAAFLLLATAGFDSSHTRIEERLAAYVVIALILPIANLNRTRLALLQGLGQHIRVAHLSLMRYGLILGGMLMLTRVRVPPSFLLLAHLTGEIGMTFVMRRHLKLPGFAVLRRHPRRIPATLKRSKVYLFTDNGLDVLLNLDLFVLGLFVTAWDLGVYAEAAVIVRFFLVIPAGIKAILRRRYNRMAARQDVAALLQLARRRTAALFSLHAILAVCVLLAYPVVLNYFFHTHGEERLSFRIFAVFVPGLVFYGALSSQEPLYEALGQVTDLRNLTMITSGINLALTAYLVPFAGVYGAAVATMATMLVYFALFGRTLAIPLQIDKPTYVVAGLAAYLVFTVLDWWAPGVAADCGLAPILLGVLFYLTGLFGVENSERAPENITV
jgi:O-antigen/teichoic acid export membrane protein